MDKKPESAVHALVLFWNGLVPSLLIALVVRLDVHGFDAMPYVVALAGSALLYWSKDTTARVMHGLLMAAVFLVAYVAAVSFPGLSLWNMAAVGIAAQLSFVLMEGVPDTGPEHRLRRWFVTVPIFAVFAWVENVNPGYGIAAAALLWFGQLELVTPFLKLARSSERLSGTELGSS